MTNPLHHVKIAFLYKKAEWEIPFNLYKFHSTVNIQVRNLLFQVEIPF